MIDYQMPDLDKQHRAEMMRQAEEFRLGQHMSGANGGGKFYGPALARVGKALSAMGNGLQERYGKLDEQSIPAGDYELRAAS